MPRTIDATRDDYEEFDDDGHPYTRRASRAVGVHVESILHMWQVAGASRCVPLVVEFFMFPTCFAALWQPSHLVDFVGRRFQGLPSPPDYDFGTLVLGFFGALLLLIALSAVMTVNILLIYRKLQATVRLWPFALFLTGFVGNIGWWIATGHWDTLGFVWGCSPVLLAVAALAFAQHWARKFVFGDTADYINVQT